MSAKHKTLTGKMKRNTVLVAEVNTLRTGDADLRVYVTTVQDG